MPNVFSKQTFNNALQLPGEMTYLSLHEANQTIHLIAP